MSSLDMIWRGQCAVEPKDDLATPNEVVQEVDSLCFSCIACDLGFLFCVNSTTHFLPVPLFWIVHGAQCEAPLSTWLDQGLPHCFPLANNHLGR